jgi:broad specificity phosphatase PhoE
MLRRLMMSLLLIAPLAAASAQTASLTVFVVRHAEKGPENPDPSLTPAGQQRAAELARLLTGAQVTAAFASEFKRTQETVAPLAAQTGITPRVIPAGKMDDLIAQLRALPPGSRAVVASHSNLVHLIVERLSGTKIPALGDLDYDQLVVVTVFGDGRGETVVLKYGVR